MASYLGIHNCTFEENASIAPHTTFKIGGIADAVAFPETEEALAELVKALAKDGIRYIVLGNGSNVLFAQKRFNGVVIVTKKLTGVSADGDCMTFGAGVPLTSAAKEAFLRGLSGLEFAYGIPGAVGGAVFMNAGAYGGQISDVAQSVRVCDESGRIFSIEKDGLGFSYRDSVFQHKKYTVISLTVKLSPKEPKEIKAVMDDYMTRRVEKQPLDLPSAGSVFKRGNGFITAQVIDRCGLKGLSVGKAAVSEKHAGFIVNLGGATADDVLLLIEKVKSEVKRIEQKDIECEVQIIR